MKRRDFLTGQPPKPIPRPLLYIPGPKISWQEIMGYREMNRDDQLISDQDRAIQRLMALPPIVQSP